jgi:sec-independent protein translocase protein TatA
MFNLGWLEVLLIIGAAVLFFGPKKLPELGGAIGKTLKGFKQELQSPTSPEDEDLDRDD